MKVQTTHGEGPLVQARRAAKCFAQRDEIEGVCVFGSVARGDAQPVSDIDLLVLSGSDSKRRDLISALPEDLKQQRFSLLLYLPRQLEQLMVAGTSFSEHLRNESKVLFDKQGLLQELLRRPPTQKVPLRDELHAELTQLSSFEDLTVFNGNLLFALARTYAVGKAIVMLALSNDATPTFNRDLAFDRFRLTHTDLNEQLDRVIELRPFYSLMAKRVEEPLPFSYRNCEAKVRQAIDAVKEIAADVAS